MAKTMTPAEFVAKWSQIQQKETAVWPADSLIVGYRVKADAPKATSAQLKQLNRRTKNSNVK